MATAYSKYIIHKTKQGERWDSLAYKYYGNCFKYTPIVMANPNMPISPFLPEGVDVVIPFFDNNTETNEELPPWKCYARSPNDIE